MNNHFNFEIPYFNREYGSDWDSFNDIVEDNVDYLMRKTWQLFWLTDINTMPLRIVEIYLGILNISYSATDTLQEKKIKLRYFMSQYANKGMADIYLDIAEIITGQRGIICTGYDVGIWEWGVSTWSSGGTDHEDNCIIWGGDQAAFEIYIDVKSTDDTELDMIKNLYLQPHLRPAFHKIFLIDPDFNILRVIE